MKKILKYIKNPKLLIFFLARKGIFNWMSDEKYLKMLYFCIFNKKLDLNNPETFNEKLQWLKLYDRKELYSKLVDKYEVKKYVADIIGQEYIIPTLNIHNNFDEINFEKLPEQFVIKCTHDSGGLIICKNKEEFDNIKARKTINNSLKNNFFYLYREWPYKNVKPRIIIEKYISTKTGETLNDYKFFCFNGKVKAILVCSNRTKQGKNTDFFTTDWVKMDFTRENSVNSKQEIKRPCNLEKMIYISEKLAEKFKFIRVDLYNIDGKIYFGELTFFPSSGFEGFTPEEWDKKLGDMLLI